MLLSQMQKALAGEGGFKLRDSSGALCPPAAGVDFSADAGRLALWPLSNDPTDVWRLFKALADGVAPVLLPPGLPPLKRQSLRQRFSAFGEFNGDSISYLDAPVKADPRILFVLLTSGSTGEPKAVAANEMNLTRCINAIHAAQALDPIESTAVLLPLAYSYALVNQLMWAVLHEREVILTGSGIISTDTLALMRKTQARMTCMVAPQIRTLLSLGFGKEEALPDLKVVNFAGAPFPMHDYEKIRALFPNADIYNNYGCTEAMPRLTVCKVNTPEHKVICVGKPIGDIEIRIANSEEPGPIEFRGSSVAIGTVNPDGALNEHPQWIASGDLGSVVNGELHVYGRHDQVIKAGAERISLVEIEQSLLQLGLKNALVWQEQTDNNSETWAIVTGETIPEKQQLGRMLRERLPVKAWPQKIFWIDEWLIAPNGKSDRKELQRLAIEGRVKMLWG